MWQLLDSTWGRQSCSQSYIKPYIKLLADTLYAVVVVAHSVDWFLNSWTRDALTHSLRATKSTLVAYCLAVSFPHRLVNPFSAVILYCRPAPAIIVGWQQHLYADETQTFMHSYKSVVATYIDDIGWWICDSTRCNLLWQKQRCCGACWVIGSTTFNSFKTTWWCGLG